MKSPFEILNGKEPDLSRVRTFGSIVFVHIPESQRTKWEAKGKQMLLVGCVSETQGYRVYNPETKRVTSVRHAVVDENPAGRDQNEGASGKAIRMMQRCDSPPAISFNWTENTDEQIAVLPDQQFSDQHSGSETEVDADDDGPGEGPSAGSALIPTPLPQLRSLRSNTDMTLKRFNTANGSSFHEGEANLIESDEWYERIDMDQCWALSATGDPDSYADAMRSNSRDKWEIAMRKEMQALKDQDTWILVPRPKDKTVIQNRWVFRTKYRPDGSVDRLKARLVAKGFTQKKGIDYQETFSPVVRFETVRILFALIEHQNLHVMQVDVVSAYLHAELTDDVFMEQPEGFKSVNDGTIVCKLKKSLYGLKQSARLLNKTFTDVLSRLGLKATSSDPCLYVSEDYDLYFALYVDDGILAAKEKKRLDDAIAMLKKHFNVTSGSAGQFVGIQIKKTGSGILLHQEAYAKKVLARFNMLVANSVSTPADVSAKLVKKKKEKADKSDKEYPYRELVGSLMFLAVCTRPDLAYPVSILAQFLDSNDEQHWLAGKRVLRYLAGSLSTGISFGGGNMIVIGYSDSDYARDELTRHSRTGTVFLLNNGPIKWFSKKQTYVTTSTCEAECGAMFKAVQQIVYLRRIMTDIGFGPPSATVINSDNMGAISFASNPNSDSERTKHWDIQLKYIQEKQENGEVIVKYVPAENQKADMFTKPLGPKVFYSALKMINMAD